MSRKGKPNYVVVHYTLKPSKSEFTETYSTAKEAMAAMRMFENAGEGKGYSEITCTATGKRGVRPWNKKKIKWIRPLPLTEKSLPSVEIQLALPLAVALGSAIGMMLPVASQANEHGLPQEAGRP